MRAMDPIDVVKGVVPACVPASTITGFQAMVGAAASKRRPGDLPALGADGKAKKGGGAAPPRRLPSVEAVRCVLAKFHSGDDCEALRREALAPTKEKEVLTAYISDALAPPDYASAAPGAGEQPSRREREAA